MLERRKVAPQQPRQLRIRPPVILAGAAAQQQQPPELGCRKVVEVRPGSGQEGAVVAVHARELKKNGFSEKNRIVLLL